jgi:phospho-N-acetylmuramoyl-pentapeptide-transferase
VISLLIASGIALAISILGTPLAIKVLRRRNIGQFIQEELEGHMHKRGIPTMGGLVIIVGTLAGYFLSHVRVVNLSAGLEIEPSLQPFTDVGLLAVFAFVGMGVIGFFDDFVKYARKQNLGLSKRWKFLGQLIIAALFAVGAVMADVSTGLSFTRPLGIDLGPVLYFGLVLLMLIATANAVNFTDGLDGLVAGSSALVYGAYVLIAFWQFRNMSFYGVSGALDLASLAAALLGAVLGFLWWNTAPAKIIMGDTGSQALGGALAALALLTNTQLLLVIVGGLYVVEFGSVVLQVASFRIFGKRIFKMAPIHHHFELMHWPETTVIVRFWILAGIAVALGIGIFYADFVVATEGALTP